MNEQVQLTLEGNSAIKNELCAFCGRLWDEDAKQEYRDYLTELGSTVVRCPICEVAFLWVIFGGKVDDFEPIARKELEKWTEGGSLDEVKEIVRGSGINLDS